MIDVIDVGTKIKTLRTLRGWSQLDLAQKIGFSSRNPIAECEVGYRQLNDATITAIEAAFGLRLTAPETEMAFAILANDLATAMQVREALALLEETPAVRQPPGG